MADILAGSDSSSRPAKKPRTGPLAGLSGPLTERLRVETLHLCATKGLLLGADGPFAHAPCAGLVGEF